MSDATATASPGKGPEVFGHPTGLYMLFFAEMWERFSYYGMRALLIFYMTKGFLQASDKRAYAIYGAYTALVYATPFIGGMLADKILGARHAVMMGGLLMAAGHLTMTIESEVAFYAALALLIVGNGFFKPNISTIVGSLYPPGSGKRDAGFTIFYIGINLGAALAPLLCGYVGETFGWHYGFGLATIGMLTGLAVFVAPTIVTQGLIVVGALAVAGSMFYLFRSDTFMLAVNAPVTLALLAAAGIAVLALGRGGVPKSAGAPPGGRIDPTHRLMVYGGVLVGVPVLAALVYKSDIAGYVLTVFGLLALGTILVEALRSPKVERERLLVVLILMFFSMLFWAFFEQAGSSVNNYTDRNVDRVVDASTFSAADVGKTIEVDANQGLVGLARPDGSRVSLTEINDLVAAHRKALADAGNTADTSLPKIAWTVTQEHVGASFNGREVKASVFQAVNPICIMVFGLIFSALWGFLGRIRMEPSTPVKFALGLVQLGLGFLAFWYGAKQADSRGMTSMAFLVLGYALHTTGELCISPVGLSMVTKLSPVRMVSTVMGGWFLATAFSNYLAGMIAKLTGVQHGGEEEKILPPPQETVGIYGDVFVKIGIGACAAALVLLVLSPLITRWMHNDKGEAGGHSHGH